MIISPGTSLRNRANSQASSAGPPTRLPTDFRARRMLRLQPEVIDLLRRVPPQASTFSTAPAAAGTVKLRPTTNSRIATFNHSRDAFASSIVTCAWSPFAFKL